LSFADYLKKHKRIKLESSILLTLIFIFAPLQLIFYNNGSGTIIDTIAFITFVVIVVATSFIVFYLNQGSLVRKILFSSLAILMVFPFMSDLFIARGHIGIVSGDLKNGLLCCHIGLLNNLLSIPIQKIFVSPTNLSFIYSMLVIWFWATILIGKGWCSWGCFFGGWDTFFSSLQKKPLIRISDTTSKKLRFIPITLLILTPIISLIITSPAFCFFVCPFKTISEFWQVTTVQTMVTFIITITLFTGVIGILSFIFGKRIWCTYICPFSVFQGFIGKIIKPFALKIDKEKCTKCSKCVRDCLV
jgi:ferredoxin-type protein NapH